MKFKKTVFIIPPLLVIAVLAWKSPLLKRLFENANMYSTAKDRASYYKLSGTKNIEDITAKLAKDKRIPIHLRQPLIDGKRKFIIFKYKSDGNDVAGYFSYLVKGKHPLLIFLRGGTGWLGIMRPNNPYSFVPKYNVLGTLYRGNIYAGFDEFAGKDIDDVSNLVEFIPKIKQFTKVTIKPPYTMMGVSRGATQMFASLAHSSLIVLSAMAKTM